MKNIGIPYLCIYKPKRQVIPILEILDKDTIINEIIPHLPIKKKSVDGSHTPAICEGEQTAK